MGQQNSNLVSLASKKKKSRRARDVVMPFYNCTSFSPVRAQFAEGPVCLINGSTEATADISDVRLFKNASKSPYKPFEPTTNGYTSVHFRQSRGLPRPTVTTATTANGSDPATMLLTSGPIVEMMAECALGKTANSWPETANWTVGIFQIVNEGSAITMGFSSSTSPHDNFRPAFYLREVWPLQCHLPILDGLPSNQNSMLPAYSARSVALFSLEDVYSGEKTVSGMISMADQPRSQAQVCIKQGDVTYGNWLKENQQNKPCYYLHYVKADVNFTTWVCSYNTETQEIHGLRAVQWKFDYTVQLTDLSDNKYKYDFLSYHTPMPRAVPAAQLGQFPKEVLTHQSGSDKSFCLANGGKLVPDLPRS
eukprot:m.7489 g.7489  ORF g.7489 m.7489 type:complete len:365 (+) comp18786_c0_seq1:71-1165(+)